MAAGKSERRASSSEAIDNQRRYEIVLVLCARMSSCIKAADDSRACPQMIGQGCHTHP